MVYLLNLCLIELFCWILWFAISHIVLKTSLIKLIFVYEICINVNLNFSVLSLSFANGPQELQVKQGYFKCISGINLSPSNKTLFTIYSFGVHNLFIRYLFIHSIYLFNGVLILKLLSNPFASYSFTNLDFSIQRSAHFDCIINLLLFVLKIFVSKFLIFYLHFTQ